ncbi:unnamed protein product [Rotaria sp. Silwood1]|nr:unnamed protein product [Rotaria sp. Silwood1]
MSSYPSRNNRYNDSARQSHSRNSRLQSVNPECSHLLKKVLRDEHSFDIRFQRIEEFKIYLEKSDSNKGISNIVSYF